MKVNRDYKFPRAIRFLIISNREPSKINYRFPIVNVNANCLLSLAI